VRARADICAEEGDKWDNREYPKDRDEKRWAARHIRRVSFLEAKDLADYRGRNMMIVERDIPGQ